MALNTEQELEKELRAEGEEYTSVDLSRKLRQANNRLASLVGRQFIETKVIEFEDQTDVELAFPMLESFDKIHRPDTDEVIDSSNYSVDNSTATVSFDQSFVDDNFEDNLVLVFYYTPTIFKDLELYLAERNIRELETVNTTDEVSNTQTDRLNQRITAVVDMINRKGSTSIQHGDNKNRGSQAPRRFGGGA